MARRDDDDDDRPAPKRSSRRRRDDDEDEDRPRKKAKGMSPLVIGGIVAAVVLLGCGGLAAVIGITYLSATRQEAATAVPREEFKATVMDKTEQEVLAAIGKPQSTWNVGTTVTNWAYRRRTVDPITGKVDDLVEVSFSKGRVYNVHFSP